MCRFPKKPPNPVVKYFRDSKVDLVVCISSVRTYVRNLQGADIVITLQDEEVSTMGGNSNGSFFVNAPHVDSVGAISGVSEQRRVRKGHRKPVAGRLPVTASSSALRVVAHVPAHSLLLRLCVSR